MEKKEVSFEEKIRELETIVKELESGEVNLDDAIEKYTTAMKLAKECSDKLNSATEKVNKILKENGATEIFIFGSIVNGNLNRNSDIDIAIRGIRQEDFYKVASILMFELEKEIDLVDLDDKTDRFSQMILKNSNLIRVDNLL